VDINQSNWNEADNSNSASPPDGAPEGMFPSGINDVLRAMMGAIKRWFNWSSTKLTGGTNTAYTLTYAVTPSGLSDGMAHLIEFNADCGASPTLEVNALGAKPLHYWNGAAWAVVPAGMIKTGMLARVAYKAGAGIYRMAATSAPVLAQSVGTTGYSALAGGATPLIMQWGQANIGGSGTNLVITFPVPFSAAPPSIQLTGTASVDRPLYFNAVSATTLTIVNPSSAIATTAFWLAIGPA
jgi:hypothetical protein